MFVDVEFGEAGTAFGPKLDDEDGGRQCQRKWNMGHLHRPGTRLEDEDSEQIREVEYGALTAFGAELEDGDGGRKRSTHMEYGTFGAASEIKLDDEDGGREMQPRSVEPVDDNDKQQVFTFQVPNEKHP